jgi:exonuclease III
VVRIFVHEKLEFSNVNLNEFIKEEDLEVCAVTLPFPSGNICTVAIYRAPSVNFLHFLNGLDAILKSLYNTNSKLIICGDINVNYLVDNNRKNN